MIIEQGTGSLFGNQRPLVLATLPGKGYWRSLTFLPLSPLRFTFASIDAVITHISFVIGQMAEHCKCLLLELRADRATHWVRLPLVYKILSLVFASSAEFAPPL